MELLIGNLPIEKQIKAYQIADRLIDNLQRLHVRYSELIEITENIDNEVLIVDEKSKDTTFLQLLLIDKIEGFHQHVYSLISSFILVLVYLAPKDWKNHLPINSVEKFLEFLSTKINETEFSKSLNELNKSRIFRAKYIDHIQQHIIQNWMTYNFKNEAYIIYYIEKSNKVFNIVSDPKSDIFIPPIDFETFYISPSCEETLKSIILVVDNVFDELIEKTKE